jgi:hypothetical protein
LSCRGLGVQKQKKAPKTCKEEGEEKVCELFLFVEKLSEIVTLRNPNQRNEPGKKAKITLFQ